MPDALRKVALEPLSGRTMQSTRSVSTPFSRLALSLCAVSLLLESAPHASAQAPVRPVTVALTAKKAVATPEGETLQDAASIKPGETVVYEATYRNESAGAVSGLLATIPVPPQLALVGDSASPAGALASTDGQNFSAIPLMRAVKQADGSVVQQPIPLTEYRALRWSIAQLAPGEKVTVSLRARALTGIASK